MIEEEKEGGRKKDKSLISFIFPFSKIGSGANPVGPAGGTGGMPIEVCASRMVARASEHDERERWLARSKVSASGGHRPGLRRSVGFEQPFSGLAALCPQLERTLDCAAIALVHLEQFVIRIRPGPIARVRLLIVAVAIAQWTEQHDFSMKGGDAKLPTNKTARAYKILHPPSLARRFAS
jgi:hypothetical protein